MSSNNDMTDEQLIGYCEIHCETERALFKGTHINRMLKLAGPPKGFASSVPDDAWLSLHDDMKTLCEAAKVNLRRSKFKLVVNNEVKDLSPVA